MLEVPELASLLDDNHSPYPYTKSFDEAHGEPIFALHTSGSTGATILLLLPKPADVKIGIPKPPIYSHDYVAYSADISQLMAPDGFESFNAAHHNKRIFLLLPPFHVC